VSTTRHIFDQLLPVSAVAGKRETSRAATGADLARHTSATIRSKPARWTHRSRTAKIVIDHLDLGPAERHQAIAHGIL